MRERILVVEDDAVVSGLLGETLTKEGYEVSLAYSGTEAMLLLELHKYDLILLDLMLPGLSGEEVLAKLRKTPVIVVSARAEVEDKVRLLLNGAVDYVTKPFHTKELLARIAVCLRVRGDVEDATHFSFGKITLYTDTRTVCAGGQTIRLTRTECAILKLLMQNPMQVLPKSTLLDRISADTPDCTESSLKMHVSNLRRKLREAGGRDYIEAVWGIGFRLREEA